MKQNLLLLLYFNAFVASVQQTISRNYYMILMRKSWPDAQNYCRMMYTDLAIIITDVDSLQLKKEAARKKLTEPAWIGLYDDVNSWRWSLNDILLKNSIFTNWITGEPNNYLAKESCVIIMNTTGYWADKPCTDFRPFVCYDDNLSGADRFIGVASPLLNWAGAQTYCRTHHTDLASSLTSSDNDFITQVMTIQGDSWFGLYRETWKWLNNTNTSNLPWYPGQPSNNWGSENCAPVYKGLYIDEECTNLHYFFCYTNSPVKKQVMRLQVKSDGSVFDPAVQSFILEQMQKKLEEHVMLKNITLSWRLHPNGNIFSRPKKIQ
ncbi:putative C-type lectin domain family 20 member A [Silurus meridionalis]|uniref:putative C-type lectin domain family 20 member A n=1 Tax=Silurus meridionalis TaxID=175797 RepID=UPI001EEA7C2A|nr:putative C-type lectin domain family 20 member A [Silurus meridionalis]